ncbi:hypothetical protein [Marilutibacter aestuarii]|uniref:ApeI dehydratase-like domain-containing protein n=1 Tax=Marilutibacter aestuarii TaxID=1706195 RepID=A0A508AS60_9GAMM|nr:hypothetical protein [Lysobacter aestuarii]TQD51311.1 hypothetical protein FKV25_01580 [Lysobacter aestuarii]
MQFSVPSDHPCLPGHFPGHPLVPGVLILDHVVEAAERAGAPVDAAWAWPQLKFLQPLLPGEQACIALERLDDGLAGAAGRWRFRVHRGDALLATGELRTGGA